jgi:hypothetical protein
MPSFVTLIVISRPDSMVFGMLYILYFLFLMNFGRQLNLRYWDALNNSHLLKEKLVQLQKAQYQAEAASRDLPGHVP